MYNKFTVAILVNTGLPLRPLRHPPMSKHPHSHSCGPGCCHFPADDETNESGAHGSDQHPREAPASTQLCIGCILPRPIKDLLGIVDGTPLAIRSDRRCVNIPHGTTRHVMAGWDERDGRANVLDEFAACTNTDCPYCAYCCMRHRIAKSLLRARGNKDPDHRSELVRSIPCALRTLRDLTNRIFGSWEAKYFNRTTRRVEGNPPPAPIVLHNPFYLPPLQHAQLAASPSPAHTECGDWGEGDSDWE
jgi:hypothetical protein